MMAQPSPGFWVSGRPFSVDSWDIYLDCDHNTTVTAGLVRSVGNQSSLFPLASMVGDSINGPTEVASWRNGKRGMLPSIAGARYMGSSTNWPSVSATYSCVLALDMKSTGAWANAFNQGFSNPPTALQAALWHIGSTTTLGVGSSTNVLIPFSPTPVNGAGAIYGLSKNGATGTVWYKEQGVALQTYGLVGLGTNAPSSVFWWGCNHNSFVNGRVDQWDMTMGALAYSASAKAAGEMLATVQHMAQYYGIT